jgi:hypothetical protein
VLAWLDAAFARISTTFPAGTAVAQNFAQASASWLRFWNRWQRR